MRMTEDEKLGVAVITNLCGLRHSPAAPLFQCSVGRLFVRHTRTCPPFEGRRTFERLQWHWMMLAEGYLEANIAAVTHVCDWLSSAAMERYPWHARTDALGRPLKLMKCGSLARLVHEANKAEARPHQRSAMSLSATSTDEAFVAALGAGYSLVRLLSPAALDAESFRMRHCVGHGAYDDALLDGSREFYSIRDPDGRSQATIEVSCGKVWQVQGPRNERPDGDVLELVDGLMSEMGWIERSVPKATAEDIAEAFARGGSL